MNSILAITAPVFLVIGLGYLCSRCKFFKDGAQQILCLYVHYCAMPCYLFLAMTKVPRSMISNTDYIIAFAISMAIVAALGGFLARRLYRQDAASSILAMMGACYTNSAYVGIPIIVMAFGQPAPIVVIALFQVIIVTTIILTSIETYQKHGALSLHVLRELPKTVLLNPIIGGSLLGILFSLQSWTVPAIAERSIHLLGDAGIPTALFALGLSLGEKRQPLSAISRTLVYTLVVLKTVVHPAIAWMVGHYLFHLDDLWLNALTLVAAMPTAMNNFVFAQRYNVFAVESGQIVFLSSIVSLFTLSGLLWIFGINGLR